MRKILRGHVLHKILFTLSLGFSFMVESHAQVSGTFTINSALPTSGSNFNSFTAAAAFLTGGVNGPVVFNVQSGSGPYNEQVVFNSIAGTSATNSIIFNCNGVTLTFLSTNSSNRGGVKLNGTDYVTFDNLTVLPQANDVGQYGYGFHLLNDADNNTIKNCHITNQIDWNAPENHQGIVINGNDAEAIDPGDSKCDNNLIQGNTISGGTIGITLSSIPVSGSGVFMSNNKIMSNTITNCIFYGIQMYYNDGTQLDANDISGGPDAIYDLTGIYLLMYNQNINITRNRIHAFHSVNGKQYGILITSESVAGKPCLIANNAIYDFQSPTSQYGIASRFPYNTYSGSYLNCYHNTISFDDQVVFGTETFGFYFETVTDVNVKNNIVTISRQTSDWNYGIYFENIPVNAVSDRNDFYIPQGLSYMCAYGRYNRLDYRLLADWQIATAYDYTSSEADPAFTNRAAFDFRPTKQAIDNMGEYVGINTDIAAAARSNTWPDPGCYEFTSAACTTPVTGGSTYVLPDSMLCGTSTIYFGLKGNSAGGGQTYKWQTATTVNGTYTDVTGALGYPYYTVTPTSTFFYRVAATCGGTTAYSSPVRVLVSNILTPGTYTINSAQPTAGINFTSFSDAAHALTCGFTGNIVFNVVAGSGPYDEQMIIPAIPTSPTKTITFNGNGDTIKFTPTDPDNYAVIKLNGTDYITLDSLTINVEGATGQGVGVQLHDNADHNTIKRCTINLPKNLTDLNYAGIVMNASDSDPIDYIKQSWCDSNLVTNNRVNGGSFGITCTSESSTTNNANSVGNIFKNNTINDGIRYGFYITGNTNTIIDSNDISHPNRTAYLINPYIGIYAYQTNFNVSITRNKIHDLLDKMRTAAIQVEGIDIESVRPSAAAPILVANNVMYNFRGNGTQHGVYSFSNLNLKLYHNTIALDDTAATVNSTTIFTRGIAQFGAVGTGNEMKNNNIVVKRGGTGPKYCIYLSQNDFNLKSDYNNFYLLAAKGTTNNIGRMSAVDYATLSAWLAAKKDTNSISIDPVFNDVSVGDLTPTKIPFENKGRYVGISTDIWNVARSTTIPDIGAFEFTICTPLTTPVLRVDSAGVNTIRFAWTAVPNTTGYRVSRDGVNWVIPTSGAFGLTHTFTGLKPTDTIGLLVKALGTRVDCPDYISKRDSAQTLADGVFIPNTFTPNGNGQNDKFKIYTNVLKSVRWMVFNQWGEKVFETSDLQGEWDGTYKGKPQPIGVYVYVVAGTMPDGSKVTYKGTFNLIR